MLILNTVHFFTLKEKKDSHTNNYFQTLPPFTLISVTISYYHISRYINFHTKKKLGIILQMPIYYNRGNYIGCFFCFADL